MANLGGHLSLLEQRLHPPILSQRRISRRRTKGLVALVNPRVPPLAFHLHVKPVKILPDLQRRGHFPSNHPILLQDRGRDQDSALAEQLTVLPVLSLRGHFRHPIAHRHSTIPLRRSRLRQHLRLRIHLPSDLSQLPPQLAAPTSLQWLAQVSEVGLVDRRILLGRHPLPRRYRRVAGRCSPLVRHRLCPLVV